MCKEGDLISLLRIAKGACIPLLDKKSNVSKEPLFDDVSQSTALSRDSLLASSLKQSKWLCFAAYKTGVI